MNCECGTALPNLATLDVHCSCGRLYRAVSVDKMALLRRVDNLETRIVTLERVLARLEHAFGETGE